MIEILSYTFIQKAFLGGIGIAICCGLMGPFLVLRKLSLMGDGLAHLAFGGVFLGLWLGMPPLLSALILVVVGSIWVNFLIKKNIYGDAAIALLLSLGVGMGVVFIGIIKEGNTNIYSYLIGSIFSLNSLDIIYAYGLLALIVLFFFFCYRDMFNLSFNEELAYLSKKRIGIVNTIFIILVAFLVVISIRAVGTLLVSALLVIPSLIALNLSHSFKQTLLIATLSAVSAVIMGIIVSLILNIAPGGAIVLILFIGFVFSNIIKK